ncbi:MAG: GNAT family N-acetyltransferase, partial [Candidatus Hermodarchaeota archaeon]
MLQELHYSLDEKDRYFRFFAPIHDFRHKKIQPMVNIDYSTDMILVGEYTENGKKSIIALGAIFKTLRPSNGELAFVVHKAWRKQGITKFLLRYLVKIARELKYNALSGSILLENKAMLHVIDNAGYPLTLKKIESGVTEFVMDISME